MPEDPLFPELPEDVKALSDAELDELLVSHEKAMELINGSGPETDEYLGDLDATEVIAQMRAGADAILMLRAEQTARVEAHKEFESQKAEIVTSLEVKAEADDEEASEEESSEESSEEASEEASEEEEQEAKVDERELVLADGSEPEPEPEADPDPPVRLRRLPAPTREQVVVSENKRLSFVASGLVPSTVPGSVLETTSDIADAMAKTARALGTPTHHAGGREDKHLVASLDYSDNFPESRRLTRDGESNSEKIAAIGNPYLGAEGMEALLASGGLCAPAENIYSMPNLATTARPVRDALPSFRAERGAINVPVPTTMGDADGAITLITADNDALGGTFATKSCLDMDCPSYDETAVTTISHCREYGNLNAMSWPEKIRHENELTMAEHARVAEGYLLDRLKALSIAVTIGAETLAAQIYILDAILKGSWGIRGRLRMPREARFQLIAPMALSDILLLDTFSTANESRWRSRGDIEAYLEAAGVDIYWYIDTPSTDTTQLPDSAQTAAAIDGFPDNLQMALFPAGTFLHLDMAELNLGIVRDSVLNSTNDFQVFGEVFENVARIGPAQAAYWITADVCAMGGLAPAGTARTCD